jgi:hypothetical protein
MADLLVTLRRAFSLHQGTVAGASLLRPGRPQGFALKQYKPALCHAWAGFFFAVGNHTATGLRPVTLFSATIPAPQTQIASDSIYTYVVSVRVTYFMMQCIGADAGRAGDYLRSHPQKFPHTLRIGPHDMKRFLIPALIAGLICAGGAQAEGCLKGAVAGAAIGHVAGHHAVLGALAGCAIGHHMAKEHHKDRERDQYAYGSNRDDWSK